MDQRIASLESALETLDTVSEADYPTVRLTILQAGGDDFVKGIRISLPRIHIITKTGVILEDGSAEVVVTLEDADPFEIEKEVLINVIKNVLQVSYSTRWLLSPV